MPEGLVAAALVTYNNALNRWPPFHGWAYVPLNLAAGAALVAVALGPLGLTARRAGLLLDLPAVALGLALGAVLAAPLFALARSRRGARLVADARAAGDDVLYRTFVRIPLGTALFEEVIFRGVLFGLLLDRGRTTAVVASAVAFGLWHLEPARLMAKMNRRPVAATIAVTLLLTTAAGSALALLRVAGGGVALTVGLHGSLNALGNLASRQALRSTF